MFRNNLKSIIVVPGLAARPIGTSRSRKGNEVWIRDFLSSDFPEARVLLYSYKLKLSDSSYKVSISNIAKALLDRVTTFRRDTFVSILENDCFHILVYLSPKSAANESHHLYWSQPWWPSRQKGSNTHNCYSVLQVLSLHSLSRLRPIAPML